MAPLTLAQAVDKLAHLTQNFSDFDLDQPWKWQAHAEGVRFALLGSYHELHALALDLAATRATVGPPVTLAQRALAYYVAGYRDLQAVLLGVEEADYDREPAPGEWPMRYVLAHMTGAQRTFFTLVHYGRERQRDGQERPARLPEGETERVTGPDADFQRLMDEGSLSAMRAFHEAIYRRTLDEFTSLTDAEVGGPSLWWENESYPLHYRIQRFDDHLRQHTIQAEKTLEAIGKRPNEAKRLLRLVYHALAEFEGAVLGAEGLGAERQQALAQRIADRAEQVAATVAQAHQLIAAIQERSLERAGHLLDANPALVNALNPEGISALLAALYNGRQDIVAFLRERGAEIALFEAAALGETERAKECLVQWPEWLHEYGRDGFTPLQLACFFGHEELARWFMVQGADIHATSKNGLRVQPLHAAAASGNLAIVRDLLARGADVNTLQQGDGTVLHTAAGVGNLEMAELFLAHGADPNAVNERGQSPLALAQQQGHAAVAERLRQRGATE